MVAMLEDVRAWKHHDGNSGALEGRVMAMLGFRSFRLDDG